MAFRAVFLAACPEVCLVLVVYPEPERAVYPVPVPEACLVLVVYLEPVRGASPVPGVYLKEAYRRL